MKEKTKLTTEQIGDVDELAKHANPISRPIKLPDGKMIGHDMRKNRHDDESDRINVIFMCEEELQDFITNHGELISKLEEQYGELMWANDMCPKYRPHMSQKNLVPFPGNKETPELATEQIGDVDELAKHANPISRPIKLPDGKVIGHDMRKNPHDEESERINIVFICADELQDFIDNHGELITQLKEQYGKLMWANDMCPKYNPHRNQKRNIIPFPGHDDDDHIRRRPYDPTGEKYSERERILRQLHFIINMAIDKDLNEHLDACSIPPLWVRNRNNLDRYSPVSNNSLSYTTQNFRSYKTAKDFLRGVMAKITGKPTPYIKEYAMPRLFNQVNSNWEKERKTRKTEKNYGLTDIYQLEKYGFSPEQLEVTVASFLTVEGVLGPTEYLWKVHFKNEHGKKIEDEVQIKGGLKPNKTFTIEKRVTPNEKSMERFKEGFKEDDPFTVLDDLAINEALREALDELKGNLMAIKPKDALKIANLKQYDVKRTANESIMSKVIKDIKKLLT